MINPGKNNPISFSKTFKQLMAELSRSLPAGELKNTISHRADLMTHHQTVWTMYMLNHHFTSVKDKLFKVYRAHEKELKEGIEASFKVVTAINHSDIKSEDLIALRTCCLLNISFSKIIIEFASNNDFLNFQSGIIIARPWMN